MYSDNGYFWQAVTRLSQRTADTLYLAKLSLTCGALAVCFSAPLSATEYFESFNTFKKTLMQQSSSVPPLQKSQSIILRYNNSIVSFEYDNWQLQPDSVCYAVKFCSQAKLTRCMQAAGSFFRETCETLKQTDSQMQPAPELQQLYCQGVKQVDRVNQNVISNHQ